MHILVSQELSLDEIDAAVDLGQSPADLVVLSFSDSDLSGFSTAAESIGPALPSLRLGKLSALRHPMSVDLYVDAVIAHAKFVLVRLLGGMDYWRYGAERLSAIARERGIALALIPGDLAADPRLHELSTVDDETWERLRQYCVEGGRDNLVNALKVGARHADVDLAIETPRPLPRFGCYLRDRGACEIDAFIFSEKKPIAALIFYRTLLHVQDMDAINALYDGLQAQGFDVLPLFVTSLKEEDAATFVRQTLGLIAAAVIVNTTAFSARVGSDDTSPLDVADVPVLQAALASAEREAWAASSRGLGAADIAMNVVLPEIDGRIFTGAISFKQQQGQNQQFEFNPMCHAPEKANIAHLCALAANWAKLSTLSNAEKKLALILPDYPGKAGRAGSGVGLDGPASVEALLGLLRDEGYGISHVPAAADLFSTLTECNLQPLLDMSSYQSFFSALPDGARDAITARWGAPETDPNFVDGFFHHRIADLGHVVVAVQPDRAAGLGRKEIYHDPQVPPCHGYVAFHAWLHMTRKINALVPIGAHGTLEWLPGKAVALSDTCFPRLLIGSLPVLYPFIVSNPGEAAQAKRRLGAVTIGHMTPPVMNATLDSSLIDLEALVDEFSNAQTLDPRRAKRLAEEIISSATSSGLMQECGIEADMSSEEVIVRLDAMLCDLKEMRIRDGQHIYGVSPLVPDQTVDPEMAALCARREREAMLRGLSGRFIAPGPSGAPSRGRRDTLPTGRNLFTIDPRAIPTRMAMQLGKRAAEEFIRRYMQDHGECPRHVILDLWASASMRTGGEDLAQALTLIGVRPQWDHTSTRVNGFEILPLAKLDTPRVDVTLRISGLFRDVFPAQITLFEAAANAVAELDEPAEMNPLAAARHQASNIRSRIFGPAPQTYGTGIERLIADDRWATKADLGEAYRAASLFAYGTTSDGDARREDFDARMANADAILHINDVAESDALETDSIAAHVGGLSLAARLSGATPALYESDTGNPDLPKVRDYKETVARATRGRAANPQWIAGQMRHGATGAATMANSVDALFALAATTDAVSTAQFELLYDAYIGNAEVCAFLQSSNPQAHAAIIDRFEEALRRGFWIPRRNSTAMNLAAIKGGAA